MEKNSFLGRSRTAAMSGLLEHWNVVTILPTIIVRLPGPRERKRSFFQRESATCYLQSELRKLL